MAQKLKCKMAKERCMKCKEDSNIEDFNAFEGKRYKDYDSKFDKDILYKKRKLNKCSLCSKMLKYKDAYWGFNRLFCKKHYIQVNLSNHEAVAKMVKRIMKN